MTDATSRGAAVGARAGPGARMTTTENERPGWSRPRPTSAAPSRRQAAPRTGRRGCAGTAPTGRCSPSACSRHRRSRSSRSSPRRCSVRTRRPTSPGCGRSPRGCVVSHGGHGPDRRRRRGHDPGIARRSRRWMGVPVVDDHPATPFPQIAEPDRARRPRGRSARHPATAGLGIFSGARPSTARGLRPVPPRASSIAKAADLSVGGRVVLERLCGLAAYTVLVGSAIASSRGAPRPLPRPRRRASSLWASSRPTTVTADTMTLGFSILVGALILKTLFLRRRLSAARSGRPVRRGRPHPAQQGRVRRLPPPVLLVPAALLPGRRGQEPPGRWASPGAPRRSSGGTSVTTSGMVFQRAGSSGMIAPDRQVAFVLDHPVTFVRIMVNTFSSRRARCTSVSSSGTWASRSSPSPRWPRWR